MVMSGYEFDNINIIPSMFAELHKAPPVDIFFDMYGNNISFEEATKNLYDKEMEADYGTDLFDEFLAESVGTMGGLDDDAVEKAIYQTNVAQEQGIDPSAITTPYGPGLTQDEIDQVIDEFPGINVGIEWRNMDEQFQGAEQLISDEDTSASIDAMMDEIVRGAEDEGGIDSLGDIFKAVGDQIGNAVESIRQTVTPQTAYAEELTTDSQDTATDVTQDLWLSELLNSGTVKDTANTISTNLSAKATNNPLPTQVPSSAVDELMQIFDKTLIGQTSNRAILKDIDLAFSNISDTSLFTEAMMAWITTNDWDDKVENAGAKPSELFNEIASVFGKGAGATDIDTSHWSGSLVAEPRPAKEEVGLSEEEKEERKLQNIIEFVKEEAKKADKILTDKEVKSIAGILQDTKKSEEDLAAELIEEGFVDPDLARTFAGIKANFIAVEPSVMRERHIRALSKAFYETMYSQPWGGRAEFASLYPAMLSETKTLFLIDEALPGIEGLTRGIGESPELGATDAPSPVGDKFKIFLNKYLQNPKRYRTGARLAGQIARINELLNKNIRDSDKRPVELGGNWSKEDRADWLWIEPMFVTGPEARVNQYNLITMAATQGREGYIENIYKNGASRAIKHYENMGYAGSEIFSLLTKMFTADTLVDPALGSTGEGYKPDYFDGLDKKQAKAASAAAAKELKATEQQSTKAPRTSYVDEKETYEGQDPRLSYAGEPTELDRDIDRILSRSSGMQVASPRNALIQNRMEFHDETLAEATDWVDESMGTFPGQPDPSFLPGAERYADFGVDPMLSRIDIEDILTDFDLATEIRKAPVRRTGPSPSEIDAQLMLDFGM